MTKLMGTPDIMRKIVPERTRSNGKRVFTKRCHIMCMFIKKRHHGDLKEVLVFFQYVSDI